MDNSTFSSIRRAICNPTWLAFLFIFAAINSFGNIPIYNEGTSMVYTDTDNDGVPDGTDVDDDNDGIIDVVEDENTDGDNNPATYPTDTDGDSIPDYLDVDSDNDGVIDNVEAQTTAGYIGPSGTDSDGNGLDDNYEETPGSCGGLIPIDTDGDSVPDYLDIDSDNDGILDNVEAQTTTGYIAPCGMDTDGNGLDDHYEETPGSCGGLLPVDTDGDSHPDFRDIDSDNDGILDNVEAQTEDDFIAVCDNDSDGNGLDDHYEDYPGSGDGITPINSDSDSNPDFRDIDSDDDGIPDNVEAQTTDGYIPPSGSDDDNDGLDNAYEGSGDEGLTPVNTDGTDERDYLDLDTDNDLLPDNLEGNDFNTDGIPDQDYTGVDTDGDGLDDGYEGSDVNDGFDVNDEIDVPSEDLPDEDGTEDVDYRDVQTMVTNITVLKVDTFNDENEDGNFQAGETISYAFTVTNTGNVTLSNITVTDPLVTVTGGPLASLAPGATDTSTFTASYTITQDDIDAGSFSNTAFVNAQDPNEDEITTKSDDPDNPTDDDSDDDGNPDDPTVTDITQTPNIIVLKVDTFNDENEDGNFQAGETISYAFTVTNTGNVTLSNITVTDPLVTVTGGPLASLAPGATDTSTFTASYTITQADIDAGSFSNTAFVNAQDPNEDEVTTKSDDPDNPTDDDSDDDGNPDDPTVTDITQTPNIIVLKVDTFNDENEDGNFQAGETISYAFTVTNTGNVTLSNITVTDPLVTVTGGPLASLAPGATDTSTFTASYTITQDDIDTGSFSNTAFVNAQDPNEDEVTTLSDDPDDPTDNDSDGDGNPDDPTVTDITQTSNIIVLKVDTFNDENEDGNFQAGETISYAFTVTNTGNVTLSNITVTDPLVTVTGGPLASLAPGATDTSTFTASYTITQDDIDAGSFSNTAFVNAQDPNEDEVTTLSDDPDDPTDDDSDDDGNPDDPTVTDITQTPNIIVLKVDTFNDENEDGNFQAGETISYAFTVTNTGNVTLSNITVTDPLVTVTGGPLASLAPGATDTSTFTASYTITQDDIDTGSFSNTAFVNAQDPNEDEVTTLSDDPDDPTDNDSDGDGNPDDPTVTIIENTMVVAEDDSTIISETAGATGGIVPDFNVLTNDTLNGAPVDLTLVTLTSTPTGPLTVNSDGTVSVAADTAPGTYTIEYTICETANSTNCDTATVTITVAATLPIDAVDDATNVSATEGLDGGQIPNFNVLNNDTLNGVAIDAEEVTLTSTPAGPLTINSDGTVSITPDTDAGTYTIEYTICEIANPTNCDTATVTIVIEPIMEINAVDDTIGVSASEGSTGGIIPDFNVLNNDTLDDAILNPADVTLSSTPTGPLTINSDGTVSVAPDTDSGTYTIEYTICENANPSNCDTATVTVVVRPSANIILLKVDTFNDENGDGYAQVGETINYVFTVTNNGEIPLGNITITDPLVTVSGGPLQSLEPGESDSTTFTATYTITQADIDNGSFSNSALVNAFVPDNGPVGSLSDDPDNPTDIDSDGDGNPDDPTVTDLPLSPIVLVIVAVDDDLSDTPVDGDAGGVISDFNVLDNDTLNGAPVDLTLVTLTSTPTGPLTINADGTVSVAPGTSPGTYIIDYTICEIANPTNCDTATVTVEVIPVMPPPPIDAVDDDFRANPVDGNFGGFVANGVLFVFDNDTLDGELLNPSEVTLTSTPTGPLTINADGTVSVAPNTREGTYTIDYTICEIANPNNCDTATVTVEVVIPPVVVNQMVTPNSDGRNDFLFIRGVQSARNNSLKVFNRWGIAVYEGLNYNNQNNVFDGRSRGRSTVSVEDYLPAGIYFYIFEYDFNNERVTDNGYLYLSK